MRVLRDVLIATGEIDKYFDSVAPVTLWRAKKRDDKDVFGLVEEEITLSSGASRPADITIDAGPGGKPWVRVHGQPRGISTFDKANLFKGQHWEYYRIEKGTELPIGLAIVRDSYNLRFGARHYTIAPVRDMPLEEFKSLLRILASRLIREVA